LTKRLSQLSAKILSTTSREKPSSISNIQQWATSIGSLGYLCRQGKLGTSAHRSPLISFVCQCRGTSLLVSWFLSLTRCSVRSSLKPRTWFGSCSSSYLRSASSSRRSKGPHSLNGSLSPKLFRYFSRHHMYMCTSRSLDVRPLV
jgi:hypothetical protein